MEKTPTAGHFAETLKSYAPATGDATTSTEKPDVSGSVYFFPTYDFILAFGFEGFARKPALAQKPRQLP